MLQFFKVSAWFSNQTMRKMILEFKKPLRLLLFFAVLHVYYTLFVSSSTEMQRERLSKRAFLPVLADREGEVGAVIGLSKRHEAWPSFAFLLFHMHCLFLPHRCREKD
jgi:hypothetical protein